MGSTTSCMWPTMASKILRPRAIDLTVDPIDDAPKALSIQLPQQLGLGFEVALRGEFSDDGSVSYGTSVNWGDGSAIENEGDFVEDEAQGEARLQGVKLIKPVADLVAGQAIASHTYTSAGTKNIQWCIWDEDGDATCQNRSVDVQPSVYLDLKVTAATNDAAMGTPVSLAISITNVEPRGVPGMIARNVRLRQDADSQLQAVSLSGAPSGCAITAGVLDCALGDLAIGAVLSFDLQVTYSGALFYSELASAAFEASNDTASVLVTSLAQPVVSFVADMTDSDGDGMTDAWETAFGLDPNSNDSNGDLGPGWSEQQQRVCLPHQSNRCRF